MRVLVIGGTGFIGRAVVQSLAERGHRVTVLHRGHTQADLPAGVERVLGDRTRLQECKGALLALRPEALVDAAAGGPGTAMLADVFRDRLRASVHLSSQAVYRAWQVAWLQTGDPDPVPLAEDAPLRDRYDLYGTGYEPILAEQAVMGKQGFPACVLRLGFVYGPHDGQAREWVVVRRLLDGRTVLPVGAGAGWLWTRLFVRDAAGAVLAALGAPSRAMGQVFNVGEAAAGTLGAWARAIARSMDRPLRLVHIPDPLLPEGLQLFRGRRQHMLANSSRIRATLGWREETAPGPALTETVAWLQANPPQVTWAPDYGAEDAAVARARHLGVAHDED